MRFTDGYWQLAPGFTELRTRQVVDVDHTGESVVVHAATAPIEGRRDTLNRALIRVSLDAPAPGVIRVSIVHHSGAREPEPHFAVEHQSGVGRVELPDAPGAPVVLRSGPLAAVVATTGDWDVRYVAEGQRLTASVARSVGVLTDDEGTTYVREQLALDPREHVFGLGERFGPLVKNGQSIDMWNSDGGTATDQAYKNVPFYVSDRGYGVLVDQPERVSFEIGTEVVSRVQFSVPGESLTYYVIAGPTPKDVLRRYTALTGRPPRVPAWSYGLWLSTSFTTDYDEATVTHFVDGMAERGIPLSVFHFDCFWMREFHWCDFVWDPATFPDPEGMLARLHERDLKVCVWINPYIAQRSRLFEEGRRQGYLVRRPDGSVWQWDMWQAGMALVDFTNPDAVAWYQSQLRVLLRQGVDAFKTDFGERVPTDVMWHDGSDPQRMHNYYTQLYNRAVFELLEEERGAGEAVLFARSATVGGQKYPVHWGGDCESTFSSMAESLRGGLSLATSGFAYWSHDIGGFEGAPEPELFKRWLAFGLLSSHSRLHGSSSYRVPWAFDEESVDVARQFTRLKLRLMPYLARLAEEATTDGVPMMRPMLLEFPADRGAATVDTQYMLGDALLVAPVFDADGWVDYYVPEGTWTHLLSGAQVAGPRWVREQHDVFSLPVMVRPGSVVPMGATDDTPEYDWADGVVLHVVEPADGAIARVEVPRGPGASDVDRPAAFTVSRYGRSVRVEADGAPGPWSVRIVIDGQVTGPVAATGATVEVEA